MFKTKTAKIVTASILAIVILVGGVASYIFWDVIFDANDATISPLVEDETFAEWMSYLDEDTAITDIVMLGSHDAGCVNMSSLYGTQMSGFYDQLAVGTRYFDMRIWNRNDEFGFVHGSSDSYGISKASDLDVRAELQDISDFLEKYPTEIIIIDMQHTWSESEQECLDLVFEVLGRENCLSSSDIDGDFASTTIGEMRELGKSIIIIHRNEDIAASDTEVFSRESYLYSPYTTAGHTTKDADEFFDTLDGYIAASAEMEGAIFVLQSQLTGSVGNFNILDRDIFIRSQLNDYLFDMRSDSERLSQINVVMRDFVTVDLGEDDLTAYEIIYNILSLNIYKGTIDADKTTEFETYLARYTADLMR